MCCVLAALAVLGPRVVLFLVWLLNSAYLSRAYNDWILPLLGFVFLPWTTLGYAFAVNQFPDPSGFGGVSVIGLIIVAVTFLFDLGSYGGSFRGRGRWR